LRQYKLKRLDIGGIEINFPVVLGALAGYSDMPYRLICRSCSAPYCATEAMLDHQILEESKLRRRLVELDHADHPVAGQIMGSDPAVMAQAAVVLREKGFDVIDLNFACPVRRVVAKKRGGYMMDRPDQALEIVRAVLEAVPDRPVTLKLRRAFRETDTTYEAFWEIARGAFEAGAAAICVHARSVDQKYTGKADWDFISSVKREFLDKTILGSGDIHTAADALKMIEQTCVDGVIAARGAIGNPWLFRQARDIAAGREPFEPSLDDQRRLITRHFQMACQMYGPKRGLKIMRNFGIRYARMNPQPGQVRMACVRIKTLQEWQAFMESYYGGRDPDFV
jgi:nifR3 family TIM-barrel protein